MQIMTTTVRLSLKKYSLNAVRYAAYSLTDRAFVTLQPVASGAVEVCLSPKPSACASTSQLKLCLAAELEDEALREKIKKANSGLEEFIISRAFAPKPQVSAEAVPALTADQEKELDALIAEVETELKSEMDGRKKDADPLDITSTWEEKNAKKRNRRKA